jgi:hypothetical protein
MVSQNDSKTGRIENNIREGCAAPLSIKVGAEVPIRNQASVIMPQAVTARSMISMTEKVPYRYVISCAVAISSSK